jgi:prepilin-type N-terminal cleavage/methylation domain-containing protein
MFLNQRRRATDAFTLIELLVVIAIIAILAAILFPVFSRAKEAAKKTSAIAQMRQLSMAVMQYADDHDGYFPPATNYGVANDNPIKIWSPIVQPYVRNVDIFVAPGSNGKYADSWATRNQQTVGYSGATAYDPAGCVEGQPDTNGCEGFTTVTSFSKAEEAARVPILTVTPGGPLANKYRGYVFSPYNGNSHPTDNQLGLPLVSDRDLVKELNYLPPAQLKPVYCMYQRTGQDDGTTPIVFADGHTKAVSAKAILGFVGGLIWRFR